MRCLSFARESVRTGARRVRSMRFDERSLLPASAACVVANGVRETLGGLYGSPLQLRLFEPVIPSPQAWTAIAAGAILYRLRGTRADAVIVLRPRDAVALASYAFGESSHETRPLSPLERNVLDRAVRAIAGTCASFCGVLPETAVPEPVHALAGFVTYVELQVERPFEARIGIALSRDPQPEARVALPVEHLYDLRLEVALRSAPVMMTAAQVASLEPGAIVPMTEERMLRGTLTLAGRPLARGECGVRNGRFALAVETTAHERKEPEEPK